MKKLILLLLVLVGGVMSANAQRQTEGTIRVAFTDPSNTWQQTHFYMYVYDTSTGKNDSWPGVDITTNTIVINGATYYYRDFPIDEYGTGFKVIAVNDDGNGGSRSQSEDLTWCYDRTSITGDTYYSLKDEWDGSKRKAQLSEMYYIADYENSGKILLASQSGNSFTAAFSTDDFPKFVVANSYAFDDNGKLVFNGYPANIYRPNYENILAFENVEKIVSDSERSEFYRWQSAGFWNASSLTGVNISMSFNIDNWNPTQYSISPSFTRTINGAESNGKYYATFSSDYDVAVPTGITAYYGEIIDKSKVIMTSFGEGVGIASTDAAFLEVNSASDTYTFTPATSTRSGSNLMKKPAGGVTPEGAYVFANQSAGVGFYKTTTDLDNQQGKAYLGFESSAPSFSIEIEGETTGIKVINFNEDNNLNNGQMFDLQGRRIADPTKGVYIVNGKKVIIK